MTDFERMCQLFESLGIDYDADTQEYFFGADCPLAVMTIRLTGDPICFDATGRFTGYCCGDGTVWVPRKDTACS